MPKTYVTLRKLLGCLAITTVIYCLFLLHTTDQENFLFQNSYSMLKLLKWSMNERRSDESLVSPYSISNDYRPINMYKTDLWQTIGDPAMKVQMYAAYFDERLEVIGEIIFPNLHFKISTGRRPGINFPSKVIARVAVKSCANDVLVVKNGFNGVLAVKNGLLVS